MKPLVLVSVGTDHHPFDRLIDWVDAWLAGRSDDLTVVVQHGTSHPSTTGENTPILAHDQLVDLFREARVIVTQVGPGTILDANSVGRKPIVVARDPGLGEHVDGHQLAFGRFMHDLGSAFLVDSQESLHKAMDLAFTSPEWSRVPARRSPAPETAEALAGVIEDTLRKRPGFYSTARLRQMLRRPKTYSHEHPRSGTEDARTI